MTLEEQLQGIRESLRQGRFTTEAAVSQGIVLPMLNALEWPVFDTRVVIPEYSMEGLRVDFALCHPANRPIVFIEVKKVGLSDGADRQLFEYAFHVGVPMAILTDGQEWSFYLPAEQGQYHERRVYKLDLLEREVKEASQRLIRYLSYDRTSLGEALKAARSDYQNVARHREIESTLPRAWHSILQEQDSLLLDLLAEKVEDMCGYKPDPDACSQFLETVSPGSETTTTGKLKIKPDTKRIELQKSEPKKLRSRNSGKFSFTFRNKRYEVGSAREVMTKIFQLFANEDERFLERFAARKHGRKRRYLAQERNDLYPGRPDLAQMAAYEISPGWWLGTNYSRRDIQKIIDLAIEVVDEKLASQIDVQVD